MLNPSTSGQLHRTLGSPPGPATPASPLKLTVACGSTSAGAAVVGDDDVGGVDVVGVDVLDPSLHAPVNNSAPTPTSTNLDITTTSCSRSGRRARR
jgi:hypothetical protein